MSDDAAEFAWWSPDSESLATAGRGSEWNQARLLLHSVVSGTCRSVDLLLSAPTAVLMADAMAWSPESRLVLSLLSLPFSTERTMIAAFVDADSAAVSMQQLDLPGLGESLVWGASGFVAFACTDVSQMSLHGVRVPGSRQASEAAGAAQAADRRRHHQPQLLSKRPAVQLGGHWQSCLEIDFTWRLHSGGAQRSRRCL